MWDYIKLIALGVIAVLAAIAANHARDMAFLVNAVEVMLAAAIAFVPVLRTVGDPRPALEGAYVDGVIR